MSVRRMPDDAPEEVRGCVSRLRQARLRPEVRIDEVPAPQRIAPFSAALGADVSGADDDLATGRFVLLHDPSAPEAWRGTYRVVTFARAALESDLAADPLLARIGWTWLEESLTGAGALFTAAGGTVTRVVSESFGSLSGRPTSVDLEVRASWTPLDDPAVHLEAWSHLLCTVAGLPPLSPGVAALPRRRPES